MTAIIQFFLILMKRFKWTTNEGKVKVQFYRRPLSKIVQAVIDGGFTIEKLLESMPTEEFKKEQPKTFDRLTKEAQFLFVRAVKQK